MISSRALIIAPATKIGGQGFKRCRLRRLYYNVLLSSMLLVLASCAARRTHLMDQINSAGLKDGIYIGVDKTPMCGVRLGTIIKDGRITDIKVLSHFVTYPLAGRAYDIIPKRIIEKQSLDVDAVTAATVSTNNIKRAVFNALKQAMPSSQPD